MGSVLVSWLAIVTVLHMSAPAVPLCSLLGIGFNLMCWRQRTKAAFESTLSEPTLSNQTHWRISKAVHLYLEDTRFESQYRYKLQAFFYFFLSLSKWKPGNTPGPPPSKSLSVRHSWSSSHLIRWYGHSSVETVSLNTLRTNPWRELLETWTPCCIPLGILLCGKLSTHLLMFINASHWDISVYFI
jgi:hypothetical protein